MKADLETVAAVLKELAAIELHEALAGLAERRTSRASAGAERASDLLAVLLAVESAKGSDEQC